MNNKINFEKLIEEGKKHGFTFAEKVHEQEIDRGFCRHVFTIYRINDSDLPEPYVAFFTAESEGYDDPKIDDAVDTIVHYSAASLESAKVMLLLHVMDTISRISESVEKLCKEGE